MKRIFALCLTLVLLASMLSACKPAEQEGPVIQAAPAPVQAEAPAEEAAPETEAEPPVTLRVSGNQSDCRALEWAAAEFTKQYPNCTVVYEYLQGTYLEVLSERLLSEGDDRVDMFVTTSNIQEGHALEGGALDLMTCEDLDLSGAFPSLINNYMYIESDGSPATKLYSVPLGAQMRGLFVNVSLLKLVGVNEVPTNQAEFLAACAALKAAGYVPLQGDPGTVPQQLLYPWMCNEVANAENYEEAYTLVNTRDPKAVELFRGVYEFMYTLVENDYYNYDYAQNTLKQCKDSSAEGYARSLLNIVEVRDAAGQGTGEFVLGEGCGPIAFIPNALSLKPIVEKLKEDYHSETEYAFVPAPVGPDGGFVYLSPADAIGINKDTEKLEWAVRFLNFLFTPENNEQFAEAFSIIPNTKDAFAYVSSLYDVPTNHISELGQATFDWSFYRTMTRSTSDPADTRALGAIARANAPDNLDPATGKIYPFEHFWEQLVKEFTGVE